MKQQSQQEPDDILVNVRARFADYAFWFIVVVAFCLNAAAFFGILSSDSWPGSKMASINAVLVAGFILVFHKTIDQVTNIGNAVSNLSSALDARLKDKNLDIFISAPITSFLPDSRREEDFNSKEYSRFNKTCTAVVHALKKDNPTIAIHYEGEPLTSYGKIMDFNDDNHKKAKSFTNIERSKYLIAIFPETKLISGSFAEIGYALAKGVKCIMFYPSGSRPLNIPSIMLSNSGHPKEGTCLAQRYVVGKTPDETAGNIMNHLKRYLKD